MIADTGAQPGFVAVYRWIVADEHVDAFKTCWAEATDDFRNHASYGSLLGQADDGSLVGVALWPDQATCDRALGAMTSSRAWPPSVRLEPIRVNVIDDRWMVSPFGT